MSAIPSPDDPAPRNPARGHGPPDPRATLVIAALSTLLALAVFTTVIGTIRESVTALDGSVAGQTWALSGMSLGLATVLLTAGAVADDSGRRRTLVVSIVALAATSALAAVSWSIWVLVAARILQGVAGAGMIAASLGLIGHAFPAGPERARATGIWAAMVGGGIAIGPLLAAGLALVGDWRTGYGVEALLALALAAAARRVPESRAAQPQPLDLVGVVTLGTAMALVTAGLINARTSWTSASTVALIGGGLVFVAAFAVTESRVRGPMLDLALLRRPAFLAALLGALTTGLTTIALMSYLPSFAQGALAVSAIGAAALIACWSATSTLVAWNTARLPAALRDEHRLTIGFVLCAAGLASLSGLADSDHWARLVPGLVVTGVGTGISNAALGRLAVTSVPADRPGVGSGANNTARYLGGAAGIALVVTIATTAGGSSAHDALVHGWNVAALVTAGLSLAGAAVILLCARAGRALA
jgi:MFS family permease